MSLKCEKCEQPIYDLDGQKIFFCSACKIKFKQFKDVTKQDIEKFLELLTLMQMIKFVGKLTWGAIFLFMLEFLGFIEFSEFFIMLFAPLILAVLLSEIIARYIIIPSKKAKIGYDLIHGEFTIEEMKAKIDIKKEEKIKDLPKLSL